MQTFVYKKEWPIVQEAFLLHFEYFVHSCLKLPYSVPQLKLVA